MMRRVLSSAIKILVMGVLVSVVMLGTSSAARCQEFVPGQSVRLVFATKAEAASLLSATDQFTRVLSPFDRSARLKTDEPVDQATYLKFAADQALDWTDQEKQEVTRGFQALGARLSELKIKLPAELKMVKTTGLEEGNAAYTREEAIILPRSKVEGRDAEGLQALLCHELFHVVSRHDEPLREKLYASIGFERCAELQLPKDLAARRITNPDGPRNNHCIKIEVDGQPLWAVPILYSKSEKYDRQRGGEFFNYLVFEFLAVNRSSAVENDKSTTTPLLKDGQPVLVPPGKAGGFFEQVGRNTNYIIHPDEILADNFVMLVTGRGTPKSPDVFERISACFK